MVNISIIANSLSSEPSVWRHVLVDLKRKYGTVDAAEAAFGLTVMVHRTSLQQVQIQIT